MVWEIIICQIEVVSFVIEVGIMLNIGLKFEVDVKKCDRGSCLCYFLYLKSFGYVPGIQLAKLGLPIDRTSSIYLYMRLKALVSVSLWPLISIV